MTPPELQRCVAEADGTVERGNELRHEALNGRIRNVDEAVRDELGIRKHVAQVVIDLRDGETKLREPGLLRQKARELTLHAGELPLSNADFIDAAGERHDAACILRIFGETQHVARQSCQRLHEKPSQREVDDRRREQRQDDR